MNKNFFKWHFSIQKIDDQSEVCCNLCNSYMNKISILQHLTQCIPSTIEEFNLDCTNLHMLASVCTDQLVIDLTNDDDSDTP